MNKFIDNIPNIINFMFIFSVAFHIFAPLQYHWLPSEAISTMMGFIIGYGLANFNRELK